MIAISEAATRKLAVFAQVEALRVESAAVMRGVFEDIHGKRIDAANVPGAGRHGISRAINGSDTNPLFRIVLIFLVLKRLGMGRERALRILEWLREVVDRIWPVGETEDLGQVLEEDQRIDTEDDLLRFQAAQGCQIAKRKLLEVKRRQIVASTRVVLALSDG